MTQQVMHQVTLETISCCSCGVVFAMPDYMVRSRRADGKNFYCPTGHTLCYTKSEADRLREKLSEQTKRATELAERALIAEKSASAAVKKLAQMKRRAAAGVCPCCNRTFVQLTRHIKAKHPELDHG